MRSTFKFLPMIAAFFAANLVITNVLNSKIIHFLGFDFPAGILTFPIAFLLADCLTETYGYAVTRKIIWSGFGALIFFAISVEVTIALVPAVFWTNQAAFEAVLQQIPRIVVASMLAYWGGEFTNSFVLAKSKAGTKKGERMWVRFVTSTMAGQAVDTLAFMTIAFLGVYPANAMVTLFISSWVFKVVWEVVALPISIPFVNWLKKKEEVDHFDRGTNFSPFALE